MYRLIRPLAAATALFCAVPCLAEDVTITASPSFNFSPSTVNIDVGDTVTFRNGGGFHNVVADDGSWRCSNECGTGSAGAPSSDTWSSSRTFTEAGTFGYFCEVHGAPGSGMFGTIIVNQGSTTPPPIALGGYLSGAWYTPGQAGHGFLMEFTSMNNALVAIWFTYGPEGGVSDWVYGQGLYDTATNTATIDAILSTGALFPPAFNEEDVVKTAWGQLTFTFTSCNEGEVHWESMLPEYGSGTLPLVRLTQIAGTTCPAVE